MPFVNAGEWMTATGAVWFDASPRNPPTLPLLQDISLDAPFVEGRYTTAYLAERAEHLPSLQEERAPV